MSRARDVEVRLPGIVPREHFHRPYGTRGKRTYPFKAMIVGDFFTVRDEQQVVSVRACLRSFYKRYPGRRFTVRQKEDRVWICRRVS